MCGSFLVSSQGYLNFFFIFVALIIFGGFGVYDLKEVRQEHSSKCACLAKFAENISSFILATDFCLCRRGCVVLL